MDDQKPSKARARNTVKNGQESRPRTVTHHIPPVLVPGAPFSPLEIVCCVVIGSIYPRPEALLSKAAEGFCVSLFRSCL